MTREHSVSSTAAKTTPLGGKVWFCLLFFGLIGQIAWIVENMYFAKFMQDEFVDEAWATTLMVALSAVFATAATVVTGAICDKTGKRSAYVSWGFILWGLTIMVFALFPIDYSPEQLKGLVAGIVIMDCVMSWVGSSANDAAFNTWLTDMTDTTNRGKADTVLSMMPVFAMVVVFIGLDSLTAKGTEQWWLFFVILGAIPIVSGILGLFVLKDKPNLPKNTNPNFGKELIYGFRPSVIKKNKMLYIALAGSGIAGASMQVYMSYLINFVERTLGMTDYVMPLAVIIVCSAVLAGVLGFLMDKFGRKHFFIPLVAAAVIGTLGIYLLKFLGTSDTAALLGMARDAHPRRHRDDDGGTFGERALRLLLPRLHPEGERGLLPGHQDVPLRAAADDHRPRHRQRHHRPLRVVHLLRDHGRRHPELPLRDVPGGGDRGGVHPDPRRHRAQQGRGDEGAPACRA